MEESTVFWAFHGRRSASRFQFGDDPQCTLCEAVEYRDIVWVAEPERLRCEGCEVPDFGRQRWSRQPSVQCVPVPLLLPCSGLIANPLLRPIAARRMPPPLSCQPKCLERLGSYKTTGEEPRPGLRHSCFSVRQARDCRVYPPPEAVAVPPLPQNDERRPRNQSTAYLMSGRAFKHPRLGRIGPRVRHDDTGPHRIIRQPIPQGEPLIPVVVKWRYVRHWNLAIAFETDAMPQLPLVSKSFTCNNLARPGVERF